MVNTNNILNKFNNELARLKNLGLEGFEPIEFKNPFLPGAAHDLWEIVIEKEVERIEKLFKIDDFMRDYNLTTLRKGELDQLYSSPEDRKRMGIITNVDYRNSLLNFIERIKEYNLISESEEKEVVKLAKENHSYVEKLEKEVEELEVKVDELEERVDIEVEMNLKALDKSNEWHKRKVFELGMKEYSRITELRLKIQELENTLEVKNEQITKLSKPTKLQKVRKSVKAIKEKVHTKVHAVGGKVQEKFCAYVLQSHILQKNK